MTAKSKEDALNYVMQFIGADGDECTSAPVLYNVFYRQLYKALQNFEAPPLPRIENISLLSEDLDKCNNSFDRYLVALYQSRYEMGHPLPVIDPTPKGVLTYLCENYGKASVDSRSFKFERAAADVLSLFPEAFAKKFSEPQYRPSIFKMVTLNYKLALVNEKWKALVTRQSNTKVAIDNYIPLNDIDNKKSRQNSAIVSALLTELDCSTPGNSKNESEMIILLPFALDSLSRELSDKIRSFWQRGVNGKNIVKRITVWIERARAKQKCSMHQFKQYKEPHHEFVDTLRTQVLYNLHYNKCLGQQKLLDWLASQSEFEQTFNWLASQKSFICDQFGSPYSDEVYRAICEDIEGKHENLTEVADAIVGIFQDKFQTAPKDLLRTIALLSGLAVTQHWPVKLKGAVTGENNQFYLVHKELIKVGEIAKALATNSVAERLSIVRPSLLHLLELMYRQVLWSAIGCTDSFRRFVELQSLINESLLEMMKAVQNDHHRETLQLAEHLVWGNEHPLPLFNDITCLTNDFFEYSGGFHVLLREHLNRVDVMYDPRDSVI